MARPPFKPTAAMRRSVSIAAGGGMTHEEIALGLGITKPTLRKYFGEELSAGAYLRRIEVLTAMHKAAAAGNVAAGRAYLSSTPRAAAPPLEPTQPGAPAQPEGKKAQANADAKTAHLGSDWESLLPGSAVAQ